MKHCPICNGPSNKLGKLGHMMWYRCQNCGMQHFTTHPSMNKTKATKRASQTA